MANMYIAVQTVAEALASMIVVKLHHDHHLRVPGCRDLVNYFNNLADVIRGTPVAF
jgi:hypothetical protein